MREGEESELPLHNRLMISAALLKQSSSNSVCMWRGSPLSTPLSPETKVQTDGHVLYISSKTNMSAMHKYKFSKRATCIGYTVGSMCSQHRSINQALGLTSMWTYVYTDL